MFYESHSDKALRFGDVVSGLVLSAACVDNPNTEFKKDYHIEVYHPKFAVILSPCCSIGDKTLALTPLLPVLPQWFKNPYFREDLTRINRPMKPEQSVSPEDWEKMSPEEKQRRFDMSKPESFALVEYFIYDKHEILPSYPVQSERMVINTESGCYMIDFRKIFRLVCKQITSATSAPLEIKLLQLSIPARSDLREKLSWYFARKAPEDQDYQ
jgi:hypothetical protein